jgi:hypothetical protein
MTATTAKIRERYRATGLTTGSSRRSRRSRQKVKHRPSPNSTSSDAFLPLPNCQPRSVKRGMAMSMAGILKRRDLSCHNSGFS